MSEPSAALAFSFKHSEALKVEERYTMPQVAPDWIGSSDMSPVPATAMMIGFVEYACILGL